jgi:murein DD-endopeptidase MepM/ murein hydrolase activator NlpD
MKTTNYFIALLLSFSFFQSVAQSAVTLLPRVENDSMIVHVMNSRDCPMFLRLTLKDSFPTSLEYQEKVVIPPQDTVKRLFSYPILTDADTVKQAVLRFFEFQSTYGNPYTVQADLDFLYTLPFQVGKRYQIIQGFNGKKSHNYDRSRYALDFNMRIGDTICAARSGIVIGVKEDSNIGGNSRKYQPYSNKIVIAHEDGTFAHYAHLKQNGAFVELGDQVEKGQVIGLSGNTGYSGGPHLHFVVRIPTEQGEKAIPIKIEGVKDRNLRRSHKMVKRKR